MSIDDFQQPAPFDQDPAAQAAHAPVHSGLPSWLRRILAPGLVALVVLIIASIGIFATYIYNLSWVGFAVMAIVLAAAVAVVVGLSFLPLGQRAGRRLLRWPLAALVGFLALWGLHLSPLGDALDQRATLTAITGAANPDDARARLKALAPDNRYAAFFLFVTTRTGETKATIKALFDQVQLVQISWNLDIDPKDKAALQVLRSRLLDVDVLLSGVPDQVVALYRREWESITETAAKAGLADQFRSSMEATMAQRQKEYAAFYVAFSAATRKAAEQLRAIVDALIAGKATRGADGKLAYGDDATKAKVEPLMAELDKTRATIVKLAEIAKILEQRYGGFN